MELQNKVVELKSETERKLEVQENICSGYRRFFEALLSISHFNAVSLRRALEKIPSLGDFPGQFKTLPSRNH